MSELEVKQINTRGQISVGKKYAGKTVRIHEYPDGSLLLTPVEVISEFELQLLKDDAFQDRLDAFDRWESEHEPSETDLAIIEKKLEEKIEA